MPLSKSVVYTPKEALAAEGVIPVTLGRGRMPKGGEGRVRALVEQGYKVKGYSPSIVTADSGETETVINKVKPGNEKVIEEFTILYDHRDYIARATGKDYSMKEVCNNCRVSLVQCHCGNPRILGGVPVTITAQ